MPKLYSTKRWERRRAMQLQVEPCCRFCAARGLAVPAEIADHIEPHHGDRMAFFHSPLQSLCKSCHDGEKQSREKSGRNYALDVDVNGQHIDPAHPANVLARQYEERRRNSSERS
jgi:5-methylcytosine-specific restriction protein A